MSPGAIKRMVKERFLVKIGSGERARYLDPTPEYAERLRLGQILHGKILDIPVDLDMKALLSLREVAIVMGITLKYASKLVYAKKQLKPMKVGRLNLFLIEDVRDLMWRRGDRELSKQVSPFLITDLVDWFLKETRELEEVIPDDDAVLEDRQIRKKLVALSKKPSPLREMAIKEFMEQVRLAKTVAAALKTDPSSCPSPQTAAPAQSSADGLS